MESNFSAKSATIIELIEPLLRCGLFKEEINCLREVVAGKLQFEIPDSPTETFDGQLGLLITSLQKFFQSLKRPDVLLLNYLREKKLGKVCTIFEAVVHENPHLIWILEHWNDIATLQELTTKFEWITGKFDETRHWMFELAYWVAKTSDDDKKVKSVIDILSESLSTSVENSLADFSMVSSVEMSLSDVPHSTMSMSEVAHEESSVTAKYLASKTDTGIENLSFLKSFINDSLTKDDVTNMIQYLFKEQHLTDVDVNRIKSGKRREKLKMLFDALRRNSTVHDLEGTFLCALLDVGCRGVHDAVTCALYDEEKCNGMKWFLGEWKNLKLECNHVIPIVGKYLSPEKDIGAEKWLLKTVELMLNAKDTKFHEFVASVKKALDQSESSSDQDMWSDAMDVDPSAESFTELDFTEVTEHGSSKSMPQEMVKPNNQETKSSDIVSERSSKSLPPEELKPNDQEMMSSDIVSENFPAIQPQNRSSHEMIDGKAVAVWNENFLLGSSKSMPQEGLNPSNQEMKSSDIVSEHSSKSLPHEGVKPSDQEMNSSDIVSEDPPAASFTESDLPEVTEHDVVPEKIGDGMPTRKRKANTASDPLFDGWEQINHRGDGKNDDVATTDGPVGSSSKSLPKEAVKPIDQEMKSTEMVSENSLTTVQPQKRRSLELVDRKAAPQSNKLLHNKKSPITAQPQKRSLVELVDVQAVTLSNEKLLKNASSGSPASSNAEGNAKIRAENKPEGSSSSKVFSTEHSHATNDAEPGSYADATKGTLPSLDRSISYEDILQSLPPMEDAAGVDTEDILQRTQELAGQNKCRVDFSVIVPDFSKFGETAQLCIYIKEERRYYPMYFDERTTHLKFSFEINKKPKITYKYVLLLNDQLFWESVGEPDGVWNRFLNVTPDMHSLGHVMIFDVAQFRQITKTEYKAMYERHIVKLLPEVGGFNLTTNTHNAMPFALLIRTYRLLLKCLVDGVELRHDGYYRTSYSVKLERTSLEAILEPYVEKMCKANNPAVESQDRRCKAILSLFAFVILLHKHYISIAGHSLVLDLCCGFSMHDLDAVHVDMIKREIELSFNEWRKHDSRANSYAIKGTFEAVMNSMSSVPQLLLVLPLYKMLSVITKSAEKANSKPIFGHNLPDWGWLVKEFRKGENERYVEQMGVKIQSLIPLFPWILDMYQSILSVGVIAKADYTDADSPILKLVDVACAVDKFCYGFRVLNRNFRFDEKITMEDVVAVGNFLTQRLHGEIATAHSMPVESDGAKRCTECIEKLTVVLKSMQNYFQQEKSFTSLYGITLKVADAIMSYAKELTKKEKNAELNKMITSLSKLLLSAVNMASINSNYGSTKDHTMLWNMLATLEWTDAKFAEKWKSDLKTEVLKALHDHFSYRKNVKDMVEFYANHLEQMNVAPLVYDCFTELVTQEVESEMKNPTTFGRFKEYLFSDSLISVCCKIFEKNWKTVKRLGDAQGSQILAEELIFIFLTQWKQCVVFFRILNGTECKAMLTDKTKKLLRFLKDQVESILVTLEDGSVKVTLLKMIKAVEEQFAEMYEITQGSHGTSVDVHVAVLKKPEIIELIHYRLDSLNDFLNAHKSLWQFISFCQKSLVKDTSITLRTEKLEERLAERYMRLELRNLVDIVDRHDPTHDKNVTSKVLFFDVADADMRTILQLFRCQAIESDIFENHLRQKCVAARVGHEQELLELDLHGFMETICRPSVELTLAFLTTVTAGTVKLAEIDAYVQQSKRTVDKDKFWKEELDILGLMFSIFYEGQHENVLKADCEKASNKIRNYQQLKTKMDLAKVLLDLKAKFELDGGFDELQRFMEISEDSDLNMITKGVITQTSKFQTVTGDQVEILLRFNRCEDLIHWLREHMKSIGEVKVMSDLALISAGETPWEVDRVSCFLGAVMGFSPLIFMQKNANFKALFDACKLVWQNASRDKGLIKKWEETSLQLGWLKTVKEFHGSVETSSLKRAQMINEHGIYSVGNDFDQELPTIENSILLKIPIVKDVTTEEVSMTLNDLHDLQSRLMLIAGEAEKGKQDVNRFVDVLAAVEVLAKAYLQLKLSGCLLFYKWKAQIRCCVESPQTRQVSVEIYFDDASPAITSSEDILAEVKSLSSVLYDSHEQWMAYMDEKRTSYYHLNHYNIPQLIYLCKQLASSCNDGEFPDQVYVLLESVCRQCDEVMISEVLEEVMKSSDDDDDNDDADEDQDDEIDDPVADLASRIQKKKRVIRELTENGFTENVAKAAVQSVRSLDVDECYLWALENAFDEENVEQLQREFDQEAGFEADGANIVVLESVVADRSRLTLSEVIERIQNDLQQQEGASVASMVKTICERYLQGTSVTSLNDCISMEHLGHFLTLVNQQSRLETPARRWPDNFVAGKPNLMVGSPAETWSSIVSIYMLSPELALPGTEEVLVCCDATTAEEVELLLRRAIQSHRDSEVGIFCLVATDQLSFEVAQATERKFQELVQSTGKNENYRLVIITSSQQHYLTALFDEHQIDGKLTHANLTVEDYMKSHLRQTDEGSAARADAANSSVRVVLSDAAGMGKSLFITRRREELADEFEGEVAWHSTTIRLLEKSIDVEDVIRSLQDGDQLANKDAHFVHIDITPSVENGVQKFLFDLLVLGKIQNKSGIVWRRQSAHYYAIEYTCTNQKGRKSCENLLKSFPCTMCLSPSEVKERLENQQTRGDGDDVVFMDVGVLLSDTIQRPYQYLMRYNNGLDLDTFKYELPQRDALQCLTTILNSCSVRRPSWSEVKHFCSFLNVQLRDCEKSCYCDQELVGNDSGLEGFKAFVVRFMVRMSQDFATPSLADDGAENDAGDDDDGGDGGDVLERHQLRRRWESCLHPYLFFNHDRMSMSFVHFNVSPDGELCHPITNDMVEPHIMSRQLYTGLTFQRVKLQQNFDLLSRDEKLATLCEVFGVAIVHDPDPTYELTTDNVLKMLAIHMRFRCDIPVILMGETGCGKTRMVEFMSRLKAGQDNRDVENIVIIKVHGGTSVSFIQRKVLNAIELARQNRQQSHLETILFLDEANTTEAIYAIKEVVCDGSVHGKPFADANLKIVAACNPYRKHQQSVIDKMEQSGLGFRVKCEDTNDKFADVPMRHLVYRVISLPPSMQPLVWDFGQLNNETEELYIKQMAVKLCADLRLDHNQTRAIAVDLITSVLACSQKYMREEREHCNFVSLRDVERAITCFRWFYRSLGGNDPLLIFRSSRNLTPLVRALIHAIGMCYHVTLEERRSYRESIARCVNRHANINLSEGQILKEIVKCQDCILDAMRLENDIARNEALRENVFMMVVCAELRIPLFLVGKPGSSKSLAKTIVTSAMQGINSRHELMQKLKQIHVSSFQCSALSDAVGIEAVFTQCLQLQKKQDVNKFVAVVVLDEIGLAEDSPKMPLKVLHPLLECGSTDNATLNVRPENKVGFVGISNWALDPAKMNRGIFVTRTNPTGEDLTKTAAAFFKNDDKRMRKTDKVVKALTESYLCLYSEQQKEFFGLRDYYGLLKMLYVDVSACQNFDKVWRIIVRNFSGSKQDTFQAFRQHLQPIFPHTVEPKVPVCDLIQENLSSGFESRYLLLLTKQYSAVSLLSKVMGDKCDDYLVLFGSSFPRDHDYTEVCRNINKIKVCMESGRTVVLLNLRDLYESLYDALNQHYVTFADQRYVDLGLGGHRVKCRIAPNFRLIVIEEREAVYDDFPIPLINRLEKHVFEMSSMLSNAQSVLVNRLKEWVNSFASLAALPSHQSRSFTESEAFVGYNPDTAASAFLADVNVEELESDELLRSVQCNLLQTASVDAIFRLSKSKLARYNSEETDNLQEIYFRQQHHDSLSKLLMNELDCMRNEKRMAVLEVTSYSKVLNDKDRVRLEEALMLPTNSVMLLTLQQFQTEQEYSQKLDDFFKFTLSKPKDDAVESSTWILLVQCSQAQCQGSLIACAKYCAMNKVKDIKQSQEYTDITMIICFLFTLERQTGMKGDALSFTTFHSPQCKSVYVDELRPRKDHIAPASALANCSIVEIIQRSIDGMDEDTSLLDLKSLIAESIPLIMPKLENQSKSLTRNRVKITNDVCFQLPHSTAFLKILVQHLMSILKGRHESLHDSDNWAVKEACSAKSLRDCGTFRDTLWLKLKKIISLAIAKVVSEVDVDNNLDLICRDDQADHPNRTDLWFHAFQRLCRFQWSSVLMASTILVRTQDGFNTQFPFGRFIIDELTLQWNAIGELNLPTDSDERCQRFIDRVTGNREMNSVLEKAVRSNVMTIVDSFVHDLVHLMHHTKTDDEWREQELEVVQRSIVTMFVMQRENQVNLDHNQLLAVFSIFMTIQVNLKRLSEILSAKPSILNDCEQWLEKQSHETSFSVHHFAFESFLTRLSDEASGISNSSTCHSWKLHVAKAKRVAILVLRDNNQLAQSNMLESWRQIEFVEMFLDQLVPPTANSNKYIETLAPLARRLWVGARRLNNLSDIRFLNILINTLQGCTNDIRLKLLCAWKDIRCKACRKDKLIEPVQLPCSHFVCQGCVVGLDGSSRACPTCRKQPLMIRPEELTPKVLTRDQEKELRQFKAMCTSFFLEYLSNFCFPDPNLRNANEGDVGNAPNQSVTAVLDSLVVKGEQTMRMSPLVGEYDMNPTARSFILQLLLRCNPRLVEAQLSAHFETMRRVLGNSRHELMNVYTQCMQDMLQQQGRIGEDDSVAKHAAYLLFQCKELLKKGSQLTQIEHLDLCSMLKFVSRVTVAFIYVMATNQTYAFDQYQSMNGLVKSFCKLCFENKLLAVKQFVVKELCRRYGMDSFNILTAELSYQNCLVPDNIISARADDDLYVSSDAFVLLGDVYIRTKTLLCDITREQQFEATFQEMIQILQQSHDSVVQVMIALAMWKRHGRTSEALKVAGYNFLMRRLQTSFGGNAPVDLQFFSDLADGNLTAMQCERHSDYHRYKLMEILIAASAAYTANGVGVIADLAAVAQEPDHCPNKFLATMPQSSFFTVKEVMQQERSHNTSPKAFKCPNGHVYFIGECTNPVQAGKCPDCHRDIGGQRYGLLHEGNEAGELTEQSQAGYLLGSPDARGNATPERKLTKLSVCTLRVCLHAALLLGSRHSDVIARMLKVEGGRKEVQNCLFEHMLTDLKQLATALGKSFDDTTLIIHTVFYKMRAYKCHGNMQNRQATWMSLKAREAWEEDFQREFLSLTFQDVDATLIQSQNIMNQAGNFADKPLHRMVYEMVRDDEVNPGEVIEWDHTKLWKYRVHIDLNHLKQKLEATQRIQGGVGAVLKAVLSVDELKYLQHMSTILNLQDHMIRKYRQKIDMSDADRITLRDFLIEDGMLYREQVEDYIRVFNQVHLQLAATDRYNTRRVHLNEPMTIDSAISMCLPCKRGRGCCALVFAEFLVDIQNRLLHVCRELSHPSPVFNELDVRELSSEDVICVDESRDLMPLVLAHAQYEVTVSDSGSHHNISYSIATLEKKVKDKFFLRKAIIRKETLPLMLYPQDVGFGNDWNAVKDGNQQVEMSLRMQQNLDALVNNSRIAELCETVRTMALVISFLAKLGGEPEQSIHDYVEKDILLPVDEASLVPQGAQIRHACSIFERLSWHRAVKFHQNGDDPYEQSEDFVEIEDEELVENIRREMQVANIPRLQLELNSLLLLGPESSPDWSLAVVLEEYLNAKSSEEADNISWCERVLPPEVLYKHARHVFRLSCELFT